MYLRWNPQLQWRSIKIPEKGGELLSISLRRFGVRRLESDEIEKLLEEARIARVCSHNEDGSIHG